MITKNSAYTVAVVGATGVVGTEMIQVLAEREFPVGELVPLASARSEGNEVAFRGQDLPVKVLQPDSFKGVDLALFSAGASGQCQLALYAQEGLEAKLKSRTRFSPSIPRSAPLIVSRR